MNSILDTIKPITLLSGSHKDTGLTGSGCIMNVVAYLNGEEIITDRSPCVHPDLRSLAISVNDRLEHHERQTLLPLISKLMGSAAASDEVKTKWAAMRHRMVSDISEVVSKMHADTPFLILPREWYESLSMKVFNYIIQSAHNAVLLKERDLIEQHNLNTFGYSTFKFWESRLKDYKRKIVTIEKKGLIDMLALLPDNEADTVVQGRATQLATIARAKAEAVKSPATV